MQFKVLSLLALSATGAVAQGVVFPTDPAGLSLVSVLATAIPSSVQEYVLASPVAFASEMASSIAAGKTPEWYAALPTDVKSALPSLFPAAASTTVSMVETTSAVTSTSVSISVSVTSSTSDSITAVPSASASIIVSGNSTVATTVRSPTLSATDTGSRTTSASSSSSSGAASLPTAVVGAAYAGALGMLGMLVL
ncbi:hypothetical protein GQ43DRAFT_465442 [Delitschia confertaspora ATCC 74209]|uniref:Uncharacterized protein n=1 Tax=Delitschia confertaspora ATCC 74209 TaxID=1513339 RepID=A0A9P4JLI4_9PLEO|nr:hypothetical protein GQ43DRAFT_465442 [Delitschia confertaspora ATCC 74209]